MSRRKPNNKISISALSDLWHRLSRSSKDYADKLSALQKTQGEESARA